ncbi:hypothetical protein LguiB_017545 [Lonicera macranthoides]
MIRQWFFFVVNGHFENENGKQDGSLMLYENGKQDGSLMPYENRKQDGVTYARQWTFENENDNGHLKMKMGKQEELAGNGFHLQWAI